MPNRKLTAIIFLSIIYLAGCATIPKPGPEISGLELSKIGGQNFIELNSLCNKFNTQFEWDFITKTGTLKKDETTLKFRLGSDIVLLNDLPKKLEGPVVFSQGGVYLPPSFIGIFKKETLVEKPAFKIHKKILVGPPKYQIRKVIIDPGHGGKDPGAIGKGGLKEKDLVLDISKRVKDILETRGLEVILTRADDTFISLWQRAQIAEQAKADLFISIHANASRKKLVHGFEIYYFPEQSKVSLENAEDIFKDFESTEYVKDSEELKIILLDLASRESRRESIELASAICDSVGRKIPIKNRGIKRANFYVLKKSIIPAILIEVGFITNPKEENLFRGSGYKDLLAENIAKGILSYKEVFDSTDGFTD